MFKIKKSISIKTIFALFFLAIGFSFFGNISYGHNSGICYEYNWANGGNCVFNDLNSHAGKWFNDAYGAPIHAKNSIFDTNGNKLPLNYSLGTTFFVTKAKYGKNQVVSYANKLDRNNTRSTSTVLTSTERKFLLDITAKKSISIDKNPDSHRVDLNGETSHYATDSFGDNWFDGFKKAQSWVFPITKFAQEGASIGNSVSGNLRQLPIFGFTNSRMGTIWGKHYSQGGEDSPANNNRFLRKTGGIAYGKILDMSGQKYFRKSNGTHYASMSYLVSATIYSGLDSADMMKTLFYGMVKSKCAYTNNFRNAYYYYHAVESCTSQNIRKKYNGYKFTSSIGGVLSHRIDFINIMDDLLGLNNRTESYRTVIGVGGQPLSGYFWDDGTGNTSWKSPIYQPKDIQGYAPSLVSMFDPSTSVITRLTKNTLQPADFQKDRIKSWIHGTGSSKQRFYSDPTIPVWARSKTTMDGMKIFGLSSPITQINMLNFVKSLGTAHEYFKRFKIKTQQDFIHVFASSNGTRETKNEITKCEPVAPSFLKCYATKNLTAKKIYLLSNNPLSQSFEIGVIKKGTNNILKSQKISAKFTQEGTFVSDVRKIHINNITANYKVPFPENNDANSLFFKLLKESGKLPNDGKTLSTFSKNYEIVVNFTGKDKNGVISKREMLVLGGASEGSNGGNSGAGSTNEIEYFIRNDKSIVNRYYGNGNKDDSLKLDAKKVNKKTIELNNKYLASIVMFLPKGKTPKRNMTIVFKNKTTGKSVSENVRTICFTKNGKYKITEVKFENGDVKEGTICMMNIEDSKSLKIMAKKFSNYFGKSGAKVKVSKDDSIEITANTKVIYKFKWGKGTGGGSINPPDPSSFSPSIRFEMDSDGYSFIKRLNGHDDVQEILDDIEDGNVDLDKYGLRRIAPLILVRLKDNKDGFEDFMESDYGCENHSGRVFCSLTNLMNKDFFRKFGFDVNVKLGIKASGETGWIERPMDSLLSPNGISLRKDTLDELRQKLWYQPEGVEQTPRINSSIDSLIRELPKGTRTREILIGLEFYVTGNGYENSLRSEEFSDDWFLVKGFIKPICEVEFKGPTFANAEKFYDILRFRVLEGDISSWRMETIDSKGRRVSRDNKTEDIYEGSFSVDSDTPLVKEENASYPVKIRSTFYYNRDTCKNRSDTLYPKVVICPSSFKINKISASKGTAPNEYKLHVYTTLSGSVCGPGFVKKVEIFTDDLLKQNLINNTTGATGANTTTPSSSTTGSTTTGGTNTVEERLLQTIENPICEYKEGGRFDCKVFLTYPTLEFINNRITIESTKLKLPVDVSVRWMKKIFD